MKKIYGLLLIIVLALIMAGCSKENNSKNLNTTTTVVNQVDNSNALVLYFSATNNTKEIAKLIGEVTSSDIEEIVPKVKYTKEDLNYNKDDSRANKEQNDDKSRPEIKNKLNLDKYNTIYLGYPIWWGKEPRIILTLLDNYNLEGKTIIPFCTSGSTDIKTSVDNIRKYNSKLKVLDGNRFDASAKKEDIKSWIESLKI